MSRSPFTDKLFARQLFGDACVDCGVDTSIFVCRCVWNRYVEQCMRRQLHDARRRRELESRSGRVRDGLKRKPWE